MIIWLIHIYQTNTTRYKNCFGSLKLNTIQRQAKIGKHECSEVTTFINFLSKCQFAVCISEFVIIYLFKRDQKRFHLKFGRICLAVINPSHLFHLFYFDKIINSFLFLENGFRRNI